MAIIHFANRQILIKALQSGAIPANIANTPVQYQVDDQGGFWVRPTAAFNKTIVNAITKLGGVVHKDTEQVRPHSAHRWAEMLPLEPQADGPHDKVLLEWTTSQQIPVWSALLQRLGGSIMSWRTEADRHRVFALVQHPPFHAVAEPLPFGWRAFVEQTPHFWVERGFRHPLVVTIDRQSQVLVRRDGTWESIDPVTDGEKPAQFRLPVVGNHNQDQQTISIPISPRLLADRRQATPTFWVLPGDGERVLRSWLQHSDDRLVRQLQVARVTTPKGPRIVLLASADADRAPLLLVEAAPYQHYLKLNNLFIPLGTRLSPLLRRDVARRTYAGASHELVWLDVGGDGTIQSHAIAYNAFVPLIKLVEYQPPRVTSRAVAESQPLFTVSSFVVRDRPAPKTKPKTVAPTPIIADDGNEDQPGILHTLFGWVKGAWQITSAVSTPMPRSEPITEPADPPSPQTADPLVGSWHERAEQVRLQIHSARRVSSDLLAELARTGLHEQRFADAAWCWQQILWQADQRNTQAAIGWVQCETLLAGKSHTSREDCTPGLMAAQVVRWSFSNERWPISFDVAKQYLIDHESELSVKAAWLAHTALARKAGNDVLTLARARDRIFERLLNHGLQLEVDVPAFLRGEDADRSERLATVRDWLVKSQDSVARWLGDRNSGPPAGDRLEQFGLARERINTVHYSHLMIGWGLAAVGSTAAATLLAETGSNRLPVGSPVHGWLKDAFRFRIAQAARGTRSTASWPEDFYARWRQLSFDHRFAVDRLRQASRILEPLEIVDAFELARTGGNSPLAQLANQGERDLTSAVENLLRQTRPTTTARLPVLAQSLRIAPQSGENLVRSLAEQLLLELEPFTGSEAQWLGLQAGLTALAAVQLPDHAERLLVPWLTWTRQTELIPLGLDRAMTSAVAALRRMTREQLLTDLVMATQRLLTQPAHAPGNSVLTECVRASLAGGLLAIGQDSLGMRTLDDIRNLLYTQRNVSARDRLALAVRYAESLRYASARVAIGRLDEIMHRLPVPTDSFATNAYYALAPLTLVDAMVRAAASEDLMLGARVRRWLDQEEYDIRKLIQQDVDRSLI